MGENKANPISCLGVNVTNFDWDEFWNWFEASVSHWRVRQTKLTQVFIVNAHTLNLAFTDPQYRMVLNQADLVLCDGIGLAINARLQGKRFAYNFAGTDLWPKVFAAWTQQTPLTLFLYGAKEGRAQCAAASIERLNPRLKVVGALDGYGPNTDEVISTINSTGPDILLVAKGNPFQEIWISENRDKIRAGVACGVGALFDFLSGEVARAPQWMRGARLEWLFRLYNEPSRLFGRYVIGNPLFLLRSLLSEKSG
jgi:N-acetylglucosaminyldiphosphoundecaprenol N-acetyl-beta-D-mannosaminyltransferase